MLSSQLCGHHLCCWILVGWTKSWLDLTSNQSSLLAFTVPVAGSTTGRCNLGFCVQQTTKARPEMLIAIQSLKMMSKRVVVSSVTIDLLR